MMTTNEGKQNVHHYYYGWCCPPVTSGHRGGALLCGAALIILGGAWLASNLGLITEDWWQIAVPLLLVAWGVGVLLAGRGPADRKPPKLQ
jgi:hypothetical protein